jgi:hypothetical protein
MGALDARAARIEGPERLVKRRGDDLLVEALFDERKSVGHSGRLQELLPLASKEASASGIPAR